MSMIDRIRELFGGKKSGAEDSAATGGAVAATARIWLGYGAWTGEEELR